MTSSITLDIPDHLRQRLQPLTNQLPRILELGLREINAAGSPRFVGMSSVLEFLAGLPTPEEIIALQPDPALQERVQYLLNKNRDKGLTPSEEQEWEQYEYLEHLVRMAKGKAFLKLQET